MYSVHQNNNNNNNNNNSNNNNNNNNKHLYSAKSSNGNTLVMVRKTRVQLNIQFRANKRGLPEPSLTNTASNKQRKS